MLAAKVNLERCACLLSSDGCRAMCKQKRLQGFEASGCARGQQSTEGLCCALCMLCIEVAQSLLLRLCAVAVFQARVKE